MLNVFQRKAGAIRHFWGSELLYAPTEPVQDPRNVGGLKPVEMFDNAVRMGASSAGVTRDIRHLRHRKVFPRIPRWSLGMTQTVPPRRSAALSTMDNGQSV